MADLTLTELERTILSGIYSHRVALYVVFCWPGLLWWVFTHD